MQRPSETEAKNVMFGYSLSIARLTDEDIRLFNVPVDEVDKQFCVAVSPADLGDCLGAVVNMNTGEVIWSDADGKGTPLSHNDAVAFGNSVRTILTTMFEHLRPEVKFQQNEQVTLLTSELAGSIAKVVDFEKQEDGSTRYLVETLTPAAVWVDEDHLER